MSLETNQVVVVSNEGEVPNFGDVSGQSFEAMLNSQVPKFDESIFGTGYQNVRSAWNKRNLGIKNVN